MDHGVSVVDAIGGALLLAGWATAVALARRRPWPLLPPLERLATRALLASCAGLLIALLLVPDFDGRKLVVAGLILLVEAAAAATVLARAG